MDLQNVLTCLHVYSVLENSRSFDNVYQRKLDVIMIYINSSLCMQAHNIFQAVLATDDEMGRT